MDFGADPDVAVAADDADADVASDFNVKANSDANAGVIDFNIGASSNFGAGVGTDIGAANHGADAATGRTNSSFRGKLEMTRPYDWEVSWGGVGWGGVGGVWCGVGWGWGARLEIWSNSR